MLPKRLIVGDSLYFSTVATGYPASAGWALTYYLRPLVAGPAAFSISTTASGDAFVASVTKTTAAAWTPSDYSWDACVEKGAERYTVDSGLVTLAVNPATVAAYDARSSAEVALAAAYQALANFNASGGRIKKYEIAGRSMEFDTAGDLIKIIDKLRAQVMREHAATAVANGQPDPRRITLRLANG